ncbi:unnamed protein product [Cuscuta epithymum]|uniref:Glycosyltransferase n=1 Tax=Cuscuta epithymum TaxID=186058 RepID=A0AAV0ER76_9ASTE|nr:unnamed protein product [Cuscuta epithymum]
MGSNSQFLHVFFLPGMAHGHMIPALDMAKLFASRGVTATIITTPLNEPVFSSAVRKYTQLGLQIKIRLVEFPGVQLGLPENCQHVDQIPSGDAIPTFFKACSLLQQPLEQLLEELRPDCLVADVFFPWATAAAAKFGIPRLVFHGTNCVSLCASHSLATHKPYENVSSDSEPFTIPNLPHNLKLTRLQVPEHERGGGDEYPLKDFMKQISYSDETSYGVIINSFHDLEPGYAEHYRKVLGRKLWMVGPFSLLNRDIEDKSLRGCKSSIGEKECLKWLDSKKPNSVVYVCFGSMANFAASQLTEMAMGIEISGQDFIWVIRNKKEEDNGKEQWMPAGFEQRTECRGLIIRGWAPQMLILDHRAVGAFVTHCGWNSTLEGICAGVPMVTWPVFAEQFINEKLVTDVLRTGVGVGSKEWKPAESDGVKKEDIADAIGRVMVGGDSREMRNRAAALKDRAHKAMEEGGSSYSDMTCLLDELKTNPIIH